MPEIELTLTTKGGEEVRTTIQAIQDNLAKARKELEEFYKTQKKSFGDPKELEAWDNKFKELNKTISDGEDVIKQYNKQAEETGREQEQQGKQTDNLVGKLGKLAAQYLSITLILNKLKTAFLETTQGMSLFNQGMAAMNQIVHNIVNGVGQWNYGLAEAIALAKKMSELRVKDNVQMLQAKKLMQEYNKLYTEGVDATISSIDKIQKLTQAKNKYIEAINIEIEGQRELLLLAHEQWRLQPDNLKAMQEVYQIAGKIRDLLGQRESGTRRLTSAITGEEKEMYKGISDAIKDMNEAITEWEEKYIEERKNKRKKDIDDYKRDMAVIDEMYFNDLKRTIAATEKAKEAEWDFDMAIARKLFEQNKKLAEEQWDELQKKLGGTEAEGFLQKMFGIDPESEEGRKILDNTEIFADNLRDVLSGITDQMVEEASRRRDLLDQQIAETQNALELEAALMEEGYANNVNAKRKELEDLKKLRAEALKDEEAALKIQRQLDTALQVSSLLTAAAQILKGFSKMPIIGQVLAVAAIAAMFASFAAAKIKAASMTKLVEGGTGTETGMITGQSHAEGGEHFLDHVEVERGERWGVLNRKASDKYGRTFDSIVSSFNRDEIPEFVAPENVNNIRVENNGPNSRLDKVIAEQRKLNDKFGKNEQIIVSGNRRIIKQGNKIRIIG